MGSLSPPVWTSVINLGQSVSVSPCCRCCLDCERLTSVSGTRCRQPVWQSALWAGEEGTVNHPAGDQRTPHTGLPVCVCVCGGGGMPKPALPALGVLMVKGGKGGGTTGQDVPGLCPSPVVLMWFIVFVAARWVKHIAATQQHQFGNKQTREGCWRGMGGAREVWSGGWGWRVHSSPSCAATPLTHCFVFPYPQPVECDLVLSDASEKPLT